jgi:hypothetical protein
MRRLVFIKEFGNSWIVLYSDRRKHTRYAVAYFDKTVKSLEQVKAWIASRQNLVLDESKGL